MGNSEISKVDFDEAMTSQLPFVELLCAMGYRYISRDEVMRERGGDTSRFVLRETARRKLMELNSYERDGRLLQFADRHIEEAIDDLEYLALEEHGGVVETSKKVYGMVMPTAGGKSIEVPYEGGYRSENLKYIDFASIENNDFAVTVEYTAAGKQQNIRVDIVVFVNGIPLAIIENKRPSVSINEAVYQHNRNQQPEYAPRLFAYAQILVAANKDDYLYGTLGTPEKFYAQWRERGERDAIDEFEARVQELMSMAMQVDVHQQLLLDLNANSQQLNAGQNLDRVMSVQDRSVVAMFESARFLDIIKHFILYDAGVKKVMRYQQYFAIKKTLNQVKQWMPVKYKDRSLGGIHEATKRKGGVIWHTQGSGKSLTMVMLVKALIEDSEIENPRVLVVTDRRDLDRQIKGTFANAGLKKHVEQATSGNHLLEMIEAKERHVITTLVQKFRDASTKDAYVQDLDPNIFVLIDEVHRSHSVGGQDSMEMSAVIPRACYLGFTGTPLLKKDSWLHKFGAFIDKYKLEDALKDKIVLPLIYTSRYVDLTQNKEVINRKFERLVKNLNEEAQKELKKEAKNDALLSNPSKIGEIAEDIANHYIDRFKGSGLKAQVVAPSKFAAILFQEYFKDEYPNLSTRVVLSDEAGKSSQSDSRKKVVEGYLNEVKASYSSLNKYETEAVESFKHNPDGVEILIVVDKLLTGFDAPCNTVLYLVKQLKEHNLLQAIARVNRLYENEHLPKTSGYVVDYSKNAQNIKNAMELFSGYESDDVVGSLINLSDKIAELESAYHTLNHTFKGVASDNEAYLQHLKPDGVRNEFYDNLKEFSKLFKECKDVQGFDDEFAQVKSYADDLKKYYELRKQASLCYADNIDLTSYKHALIKIMDENITAHEAEELTKEVVVTDTEAFEAAIEEFSTKSKADAILSQTIRSNTENQERDPVAYEHFSDRIKELMGKMREEKLADIEALKIAKQLYADMMNQNSTPVDVDEVDLESVQALFYRNIKIRLMTAGATTSQVKQVTITLVELIEQYARVDWYKQAEAQREMKNAIDDYFYEELKMNMDLALDMDAITALLDDVMALAISNQDLLTH